MAQLNNLLLTECISQLKLQKITSEQNSCTGNSIILSSQYSPQTPHNNGEQPSIINKIYSWIIKELYDVPKQVRQILLEVRRQVQSYKDEMRNIMEDTLQKAVDFADSQREQLLSKFFEEKEQFSFLINQVEIEVKELRSQKQISQNEIRRLEMENQIVNEENFKYKQRIASIEEDYRDEVEVSMKRIREEYENQSLLMERRMGMQLSRIVSTKDQVINELKSIIENMNLTYQKKSDKSIGQFQRREVISPKGMHSPTSSNVERLLPMMHDKKLQKSRSSKLNLDVFVKEEQQQETTCIPCLRKSKQKKYLITEPAISPIKPRTHTRNRTFVNETALIQNNRSETDYNQLLSPRIAKVNFKIIQEGLEDLSYKLRTELSSMHSVKK